ncbi:chemotaxis protein CheA [Gemmatimonas groenlandica]|uniref:Chemotaxis protein CheA n=1 Tax=Gemmatimonas groenlandica TaxID=2732249 RepID=A0A6M4IR56_9BACT|nr:chemotaxis protein CheA [Gemmatimonas groenlandica]QJR35322.1 chemotaxis protein CheA [Gemmatimonas groenlandica]
MDAARYAALFLSESREHLTEVDDALLALERDRNTVDAVAAGAHIATVFRGVHTIKGMAAAMGYVAVEQLSHALESRCEPLRSGAEEWSGDVLALLFDGTDLLRAAVDAVPSGRTEPTSAMRAFVQRLGVVPVVAPVPTPLVAEAPTEALTEAAAPSGAFGTTRRVDVRLTADCPLKGVRAMIVLAKLSALGTVRGTEPPQERWQDDLFDGAFRLTLQSSATDDEISAAAQSAGDVARVSVKLATPTPVQGTARVSDAPRTVRLDARRLDTLLDLVGELVITRDRLLRAIEQSEHPDRAVVRAAADAARLVATLQDEVLQARMLPVAQVFDRFPRLVRDIARDLGKDVHFTMEGREIELDRSLLDAIGDPIMHLLRNALDHGFEDAETRRAAGKPASGELILRAARDRAAVVIQVQDDGRGIDRDVVLRRAHEQGLVDVKVSTLADDALLQLVAHPGFSTAKSVTSISGRGVGVDVVNTRVRALGGQIDLETITGEGTVFTMRLPLTLAIMRALLVQVGGDTYAIPAAHVMEVLEFNGASRRTGALTITVRDEIVPLVALQQRFEDDPLAPAAANPDGVRHVAIVEVAGRRTALLVDALLAQQDIVVKPLDTVRGARPWFSGATVLGDGSPALIVDVSSVA